MEEILLFLLARLWVGPASAGPAELLVDGTEFFPARLEMIAAADRNIDLATFLWCDDDAGIAVARALAAAAGRTRRVRVVVDAFNFKFHSQVYSILRGAGIEPLIYNPPAWGLQGINYRLHEKIMVVDGSKALVGGANLCDEYMQGKTKPLWHDLELRVEGAAAADLQRSFDESWDWMAQKEYASLVGKLTAFDNPNDYKGPARIARPHALYGPTPIPPGVLGPPDTRLLHQQPLRRPQDTRDSLDVYLGLIRTATRVVLYAPYLVLHPELKQALVDAGARNADVIIHTNSGTTNDLGEVAQISASRSYPRLLGATIRLRESLSRTIHAKALYTESEKGRLLLVGSHNMTARSFMLNSEAVFITSDEQVISRFLKMDHEDRMALDRGLLFPRPIERGAAATVADWMGDEGPLLP